MTAGRGGRGIRSTALVLIARTAFAVGVGLAATGAHGADAVATIARVKTAVVAMGTFEPARSPQFAFRGTGFVVGDGTLVVTNAHVVAETMDAARHEVFGFIIPRVGEGRPEFREAKPVSVDRGSDLAILRMEGIALKALRIGDSDQVREGQEILFTGFPIGAVLGAFAATHRGMIAAISPIAIPQSRSSDLNPQVIHRLASGSFSIFQLDATAYPGNSGSPVYDPATGDVLGVVNMVLVKGTKENALSQPSGISYAVPARYVRELLNRVQ
jgi:S1-C subfamily serine protease